MNMRRTLSLTDARGKIFSLAKNAHAGSSYYTLTEHGRPKVVLVSAQRFEKMLASEEKHNLYDKASSGNAQVIAERPQQPYAAGPFFSGYRTSLLIADILRDRGLPYDLAEAMHNEKELAKAQLFIELMEKYGYPLESLQLGQYVRTGGAESRRYIEIDIIVDDQAHDHVLLFFISARKIQEEDTQTAFRDLFDVAHTFHFPENKKVSLIHFVRYYNKKQLVEKCMSVDYQKTPTYKTWKASGQKHTKKIPLHKTKKK